MNLDPYGLQKHARKFHSQFGEDGITLALCNRLQPPRFFLEIGTGRLDREGGVENNTMVLAKCGWQGIWCDQDLGEGEPPEGVRLNHNRIDKENIRKFEGFELGLFSLDVDGNDYWLWKAFLLRPWIAILECQVQKPFDDEFVSPYDPDFQPDGTNEYGASLRSMIDLSREKGYTFVCTASPTPNLDSPNAFFVRDDLLSALSS